METTLRFVAGAASLPGVRLSLISQDPAEKLPAGLHSRLVLHFTLSAGAAAGAGKSVDSMVRVFTA
ncbi:MAG: hypothetical protein HKN57_07140 [Xanthomonadales bacterium]|nr:hypothetical protein [Gammaproteobacteria bacterium]MBT8053153.1 hypothetical protein [Gammaproteobacteria bacterium]NND57009.1 hypothetical protein [Xanthomonadales bacterium]NNK51878.1 hypothetical protein [Xanthomonadales bacterium]